LGINIYCLKGFRIYGKIFSFGIHKFVKTHKMQGLFVGSFNWRIKIILGVTMLLLGIFFCVYSIDLMQKGKDFDEYGALSLLCLWGGCHWISKSML
tara:strand:+ start:1474 stop:1761 length:288 start_codon:yes stop_codon:yes gene_type:complete